MELNRLKLLQTWRCFRTCLCLNQVYYSKLQYLDDVKMVYDLGPNISPSDRLCAIGFCLITWTYIVAWPSVRLDQTNKCKTWIPGRFPATHNLDTSQEKHVHPAFPISSFSAVLCRIWLFIACIFCHHLQYCSYRELRTQLGAKMCCFTEEEKLFFSYLKKKNSCTTVLK